MTRRQAPPDQHERERALNWEQSFIVQAPAGSGKTSLLVERYLHLLAHVQRPEEILAITFTRAAAMEMKQRVLDALHKDNALTRAIRIQDQANNWQLRSNPHLLKIQTIDSFATELATQIPGEQSADGMRIEDKPEALYQQAARDVLGQLFARESSFIYISEFLAALDNNADSAERLLTIMLGKRDQWLAVARLITSLALQDSSALTDTLDRAIHDLRSAILTPLEQSLSPRDHAMVQRIAQATEQEANIKSLLPIILTQSGTIRKTVDRRQHIAFTDKLLKEETVAWLKDLDERKLTGVLQAGSRLPDVLDNPGTLIATGVTLALAAAELEALLQNRRSLDFTGMLIRASKGLRDEHGPTDLALYWDYRIKHLLIDEFQDTSRSQYEFFSLLTEGWEANDGNTFFAVGDPMQSIYRFRDADVSLFSRCWEHGLPNIVLEPIQLSANFRSAKALVNWNNELFSTLFPKNSLPELGAIRFSPATAQRDESAASKAGGYCRAPGVILKNFGDERQEAEAIAQHIVELTQGLTANDSGTIGILCRTRGDLPVLLQALKRSGIPFTSTDIDSLAEEPIVRDLLSLHRLLLRPVEPLAWFSILRSPMVGLTLEQLEAFADSADIFGLAEHYAKSEPALARFTQAYAWAQSRLYELPICEVIEGCWMRLGGTDAYPVSKLPHAQRWFDLLESMDEKGSDPDALLTKTGDLYAQDASQSRVQVMTIHKSKGLEFTHVILPNLGRRPRTQETDLLLWRPTQNGLLIGIKQDPVHQWLTFEEKSRNENEIKRLLYVACTRAEHSLWLSTALADERPAGLAKYLPAMDTVEPHKPTGTALPTESLTKSKDTVAVDRQGYFARLPREYRWENPAMRAAADAADSTPDEASIANEAAPEADERSNRFNLSLGNLVHLALAHVGNGLLMQKPFEQHLLEAAMYDWLPRLDATPDQWPDVMAHALAQIARTLEDPAGLWLLQPHPHGRFEWPVTTVINANPKRFVIDRLFVSDGHWWIVDFKTSAPANGITTDHFVAEELLRYRAQLAQYQHILEILVREQREHDEGAALPDVPIKTALYFTALSRLERIN